MSLCSHYTFCLSIKIKNPTRTHVGARRHAHTHTHTCRQTHAHVHTHTRMHADTHNPREMSTDEPLIFVGPLSKDQLISSRTEANVHWKQTHLVEMPVGCFLNKARERKKAVQRSKQKSFKFGPCEKTKRWGQIKLGTRQSSWSILFSSLIIHDCLTGIDLSKAFSALSMLTCLPSCLTHSPVFYSVTYRSSIWCSHRVSDSLCRPTPAVGDQPLSCQVMLRVALPLPSLFIQPSPSSYLPSFIHFFFFLQQEQHKSCFACFLPYLLPISTS